MSSAGRGADTRPPKQGGGGRGRGGGGGGGGRGGGGNKKESILELAKVRSACMMYCDISTFVLHWIEEIHYFSLFIRVLLLRYYYLCLLLISAFRIYMYSSIQYI